MRRFIFYTAEGHTADEGGVHTNNLQVLGWGAGSTPKKALEDLLVKNKHLQHQGFENVICQEVASDKEYYLATEDIL